MLLKNFMQIIVIASALAFSGASISDNVDELIKTFQIRKEIEAQHQECIEGSSDSIESELEYELQSGRLEIEAGDEDWGILIAIYSEYYQSLCGYLSGDEILNFYKSEIRKRFTPEEMETLLKFYKTPLGEKINEQWFEINRVYGKILNERQTIETFEAQRKFESRIDDFWKYRQEKLNGQSQEQDT